MTVASRVRRLRAAIVVALALNPVDANAQATGPPAQSVYVNLNAGIDSAPGSLNDGTTLRLFNQDAPLSVEQQGDAGAIVDFAAGIRVWRQLTIGVGFHGRRSTTDARVTGSIPDPIPTNAVRPVSMSVALKRIERAVHVQLGFLLPLNDRITVHLQVGPSFFTLRQNVVFAFFGTEADNLTFANPVPAITERRDSLVGFHGAADFVVDLVSSNRATIGAGGFVRYSAGRSAIELITKRIDTDVGGVQVGIGSRVRF